MQLEIKKYQEELTSTFSDLILDKLTEKSLPLLIKELEETSPDPQLKPNAILEENLRSITNIIDKYKETLTQLEAKPMKK